MGLGGLGGLAFRGFRGFRVWGGGGKCVINRVISRIPIVITYLC